MKTPNSKSLHGFMRHFEKFQFWKNFPKKENAKKEINQIASPFEYFHDSIEHLFMAHALRVKWRSSRPRTQFINAKLEVMERMKYVNLIFAIFISFLISFQVASQTVTIGTGTTASSSVTSPYATGWHDSRHSYIYLASEISSGGGVANNCIQQIGFNVSTAYGQVMNGLTVKMRHMTTGAYPTTGLAFPTGMTTVYTGNYSVPGTGWQMITLQTPFQWNGSSNIEVELCFDNSSFTTSSVVLCSAQGTGNRRTLYQYLDNSVGCTMTPSSTSTTRPNIRFVMGSCSVASPPSCVSAPLSPTNGATAVNTSPTLSWAAVAGATSYDVYFGTATNPPFVINTSSTSYAPGTLLNSTTYYWKIVPKNAAGAAVGCSTWNFVTGVAGCTNASAFATVNAPTDNAILTISTCQYQSEYSTINGCIAGTNYQSVYSLGGYITVHQGTFNGPIVAAGNSPLNWTASVAGTYFVHYNTDAACGTLSSCGTSTIQCTSCTAPIAPANDACASATNLPCGTSNMAGTTVNSVSETAPSACGSSFGVWYTFTGDGQQTTISSTAVFDHEMTIVSGTCGAFTNIACVDNSTGAESYTFTTTNGVVYRVYISHYLAGSTTTGTFTISRTCAPAPTPGGCNNTSAYGSANAPFNSTITITSCQFGGEYATLNNATAATQYTSSTDMAGAYFTIRQGSPSGSIVGEGLAPLTWTSTVAGTYYIHFNTNNFCGSDASCHTNVISHTCPAVAAPTTITASPATVCVGNSLNVNASAGGNSINWYTVPVGGTAIGTSASGANQAMSPTSSTTYYAEALVSTTGCVSASRVSVSVVVNAPSVQTALANGDMVWNGRSSTDYATINNWYQFNGTGYVNASAAPTTAQNVIIPANQTCVLNQPNTNANTVSANNLTIENSALLAMTTGTLNVAGNFVNNGTFTAGSGTVAFVGTGNNTAGGSVANNSFNNLTMNKAGEVLLDKPITISGTLALTNGRLNIAGYNLDMASNTVTGGSVSSFVKTSSTGEFKRNVSGSAVLFPVGRAAYNPATLTNSGTADKYGIRVVDNVADNGNNADAGATTTMPVVNRTWMIDEAVTGGSNVTLKLVWNGAGEEINGFDPVMNTPFIAHYETGAGMWDNIGGNIVALGSIEQSGLTSFSPFTISTSGTFAPLPIELVSFQANCADNNRVNVTWSTASEHNTSHFIIEKSRDGQNWKELATIPAAGNSTELLNYSVMDTEAGDGLNYYRMTQFDIDGENEMFDPTTSNCSEEPQTVVKTYPNPSDESFYFMINTEEMTGEGSLTITDAKGTVVFMQSIVVEQGNNVFHVNDFQVVPGVYFVQVSNGTTSKVIMHSIR